MKSGPAAGSSPLSGPRSPASSAQPSATSRQLPVTSYQLPVTSHRSNWLIVALILAAFALYVYQLDGQSLWRDEALSIARARQPLPLIFANRNVVQGVSSPDLHPPLYFLLLHGWRLLAGESEFAYRFPSLIATVLAIAMFAVVGQRLWRRESGLWAAALAALSPFYLWYAQETRMYMLLLLESLFLLYTLWPLLAQKTRKRDYLLFGLTALAAVYTHYSGVFLIGFALTAVLLVTLRRPAWRPAAVVVAGLAAIAIPLYTHVRELATAAGFIAFARPTPWKMLAEAVTTFSLGSAIPPADPGWRLAPFVLLALLGTLAIDVAPAERRRRAALMGLGGLLITLGFFYLASWLQANYSNPRHLTMLSPFWFLLMGHGGATLRRHFWPSAVAVGAIALLAGSGALWQTITNPPVIRDDVRGVAAYIAEHAQSGDAVVWHNAVMSLAYDYYAPDLPHTAIPRYDQLGTKAALSTLDEWMNTYRRIWFITSPPPPFFDQQLLPDALRNQWVQMEGVNFPASWASLGMRLYRPLHLFEALPPQAFPADVQQGAYHLQGVGIEPVVMAGEGTWVSLYWRLVGQAASESPLACLRLHDSANTLWSEGCAPLDVPDKATSLEHLIEQQLWLPLRLGLAPIPYTMELRLAGTTQQLGALVVQPSPDSPNLEPLAEYESGLELVDVAWADEEFRTGFWILGDLTWRARSTPDRDLRANLRVVDWLGRTVAEETFPLGPVDYPASLWQSGDLVSTIMAIRLPYRIEGHYRVQVSLLEVDGRPLSRRGLLPLTRWRWADLGWVRIRNYPFVSQVPAAVRRPADDVLLGNGAIRLAGYELTRQGDALKVDLYWRNERELAESYGIFVNVGRDGEAPLVQGGGVDWSHPIESWRKGEVILNTYTIQLPPDISTEKFAVWVGMYNLDEPGIRIPLTVNGQSVPDNSLNLGPVP